MISFQGGRCKDGLQIKKHNTVTTKWKVKIMLLQQIHKKYWIKIQKCLTIKGFNKSGTESLYDSKIVLSVS